MNENCQGLIFIEHAPNDRYWVAIGEGKATYDSGRAALWAAVRAIKKDDSLDPNSRDAMLRSIYESLSMKDMANTVSGDLLKYDIGVSFRSSMAHLRHINARLEKSGYRLADGDNPKMTDRAFAQKLGVPTPRTITRGQHAKDLPIIPGTVIKPLKGAGASGVYRVNDDRSIQSFSTGAKYSSVGEALVELQGKRVVDQPQWILEEGITREDGGPAHDLKAYAFYGEVGMVVEVVRGKVEGENNRSCYYGPNSEILDSGHPTLTTFKGSGFPSDLNEKARVLSMATPVPFIRVDFHRGVTQCYLGEITPRPGNTAVGLLAENIDQRLGEMFLDAEARLKADLLEGKTFETYFETYKKARQSGGM